MASSVAESNSDGFPPLNEHVYAVHLRRNQDLVARLQEAETTLDANRLRRVPENMDKRPPRTPLVTRGADVLII